MGRLVGSPPSWTAGEGVPVPFSTAWRTCSPSASRTGARSGYGVDLFDASVALDISEYDLTVQMGDLRRREQPDRKPRQRPLHHQDRGPPAALGTAAGGQHRVDVIPGPPPRNPPPPARTCCRPPCCPASFPTRTARRPGGLRKGGAAVPGGRLRHRGGGLEPLPAQRPDRPHSGRLLPSGRDLSTTWRSWHGADHGAGGIQGIAILTEEAWSRRFWRPPTPPARSSTSRARSSW